MEPAPPADASIVRETHVINGHSTFFEGVGAPGARKFIFVAEHARRTLHEQAGFPHLESGSVVFDGLFALALEEVRENSVSEIRAHAFNHGLPIPLEAFETGEMWQYVWTRDISYAVDLGLASIDAPRCVRSLMYKTSRFKDGVAGELQPQILQDTGTGGSYPVSTDRVIWALAAERVAHFLDEAERDQWIDAALPILCNTIEQDRLLVFDAGSGLYRGEQSFLDWREQTYPLWTKDNVLAVATSEALSTNCAHHIILETAARWSRRAGAVERADRYVEFASALRVAIREHLYDASAGMLATYRLVDLGGPTRSHQYDLLGQSLAILSGILDHDEAARAVRHYPTGPFGPPVQWPQDPTVPIYHNHAIWPFVTAYWIKSARCARGAAAMVAGIRSLVRGASLFLSNMENLDFGSGLIEGHAHGLSGPKINSRRQLWSVAGYVSMVQDAIFGLETHEGGIRFNPVLPNATRREFFPDAPSIALRGMRYRGRTIDVELVLPADAADAGEFLEASKIELNGAAIDCDRFVTTDALVDANRFVIHLRDARSAKDDSLFTVSECEDPSQHFGPPAPEWADDDADASLPEENGAVVIRCRGGADKRVRYNLYRDNELISAGHADADWRDAIDAGPPRVREYRVEAVYPESGNHSRLSLARRHVPAPFAAIRIACPHHDGACATLTLVAGSAGRHGVRVCYANGNGTIDTGLTCALRRVELRQNEATVASGTLVLPQTGGAHLNQFSSWLNVDLPAAGTYQVRIDADGQAVRNMTYFKHNEAYTQYTGGGPSPCNEATIRYLEVQPLGG